MELSQPPPDPPPNPGAARRRVKISDILWLVGIVFLLLILFAPLILRPTYDGVPRTEALNNIKQISMMLFEFDNQYGSYPDASTAAAVRTATNTSLTLGNRSSNQLFRQLLASGTGTSELPFWAKTAASKKKPDNVFNTDATALAPGECVFGYTAGLSSSGDPATPVVFTPIIPGTHLFDPEAFGGKAVILRLDNSATPVNIDKDGHAILNGMDLFDPRQPFWKGKAPDIKWPE